MTYIVDRIEEDIAVLQDEQEALHPLPLTALPDGVRPGDVFSLFAPNFDRDKVGYGLIVFFIAAVDGDCAF